MEFKNNESEWVEDDFGYESTIYETIYKVDWLIKSLMELKKDLEEML